MRWRARRHLSSPEKPVTIDLAAPPPWGCAVVVPLELSAWSSRLRDGLGPSFTLRTAPISDDVILLLEPADPQLVRLVRHAHPAMGLLVVGEGQPVDARALLDAGADDVLVRASQEELIARIRALARRRSVVAGGPWGDNATSMNSPVEVAPHAQSTGGVAAAP